MIKGAIFDIDGTLLDTMPMWYSAGKNYLAAFGLQSNKKVDDDLFCMSLPEGARYIWETFRLAERGVTIEDVRAGIKAPVVRYYAEEAQPKPGAGRLLAELAKQEIPAVIVTSSDSRDVGSALERLDLMKYIGKIFSCTDVGKPKSQPDIFLMAAEFMGTQPGETWVFEDGLYAIRTAKAIGFRTVGLYDDVSREDWEDIRRETDVSGQDLAHIRLEELRAYGSIVDQCV